VRRTNARGQADSDHDLLYQLAPVGLCALDRELRLVRANDFLARLVGR
jgi:hypothetical protein